MLELVPYLIKWILFTLIETKRKAGFSYRQVFVDRSSIRQAIRAKPSGLLVKCVYHSPASKKSRVSEAISVFAVIGSILG